MAVDCWTGAISGPGRGVVDNAGECTMALDGVEGGCKMGKYFVIGLDETRTDDDFFLCNRRLMASEALLCTRLVESLCWVRAEDGILIDVV